MRLLRGLAFVLAVLPVMNGCAHKVTAKAEEPDAPLALSLRVMPRVGMAPLIVRADIRVMDAAQVLLCPQFVLTWGVRGEPAESSGFPGESCWEQGPRVQAPRSRLLTLRRPGEYDVIASMADGGVALYGRQTVTVVGRTE